MSRITHCCLFLYPIRWVLLWCVFLLGVVPTCLAFEPKVYTPNSELVGSFLGPDGWRGHIVQSPADIKIILWEAPDGLVVIGKLVDRNGRDLNAVAQQKYQTNTVAISVLADTQVETRDEEEASTQSADANHLVSKAYEQLEGLSPQHYTTVSPSHVTAAAPHAQVYAFYDYQCPFCAAALQYMAGSGLGAKVHWLPVAILEHDSARWGAAVLDGLIDIQTMGATPTAQVPNPKAASLEAVAYNTALLKAIQGRASTPFFLYRTPSGEVLSLSGFSEAAPAALASMLSAP